MSEIDEFQYSVNHRVTQCDKSINSAKGYSIKEILKVLDKSIQDTILRKCKFY